VVTETYPLREERLGAVDEPPRTVLSAGVVVDDCYRGVGSDLTHTTADGTTRCVTHGDDPSATAEDKPQSLDKTTSAAHQHVPRDRAAQLLITTR
jgi:hypothetical protein